MPLDVSLGIEPHQKSRNELVRLGTLFSLFVPYELAAWLLGQFSGLPVSASSLWNWVARAGKDARAELSAQLASQAAGHSVVPESLADELGTLPLVISADGVMVPMRSQPNTPKGPVIWKEVKVAIFARLDKRRTQAGTTTAKLRARRLVAVLGDLSAFIPAVKLEAHKQSFEAAPTVVWLSDGGRGFWRAYRECFAHCAVAVLDFYHAAGHLWRATTALLSSPDEQLDWFKRWRHALRHGKNAAVLAMLTRLVNTELLSGKSLKTLMQVQAYFQRHLDISTLNGCIYPSVLDSLRVLANGSFNSGETPRRFAALGNAHQDSDSRASACDGVSPGLTIDIIGNSTDIRYSSPFPFLSVFYAVATVCFALPLR